MTSAAAASLRPAAPIPELPARRRAAGLSQADVAREAGVSIASVQRADWALSVSADTAERIEAALAAAGHEERPAA